MMPRRVGYRGWPSSLLTVTRAGRGASKVSRPSGTARSTTIVESPTSHALGDGQAWNAQALGEAEGDRGLVVVGGLAAAQDKVEGAHLPDARQQDLHGPVCVQCAKGVILQQDQLITAHGQGLLDHVHHKRRPHGDNGHRAPDGRLDAEGGLHGVFVEAVDDGRDVGGRLHALGVRADAQGGGGGLRVDDLLGCYNDVGRNGMPPEGGIRPQRTLGTIARSLEGVNESRKPHRRL